MDAVALPLLLGVWLFDVAALAPTLLFGPTRRLFDGGPAASRPVNFLLAATGYAVVHVLVMFAPGIVTGRVGPTWLAGSTIGLLVASWVAIGVVAPRLGWWDAEAGREGRVALGAVGLGYLGAAAALVLVVALALFAVFAGYPG